MIFSTDGRQLGDVSIVRLTRKSISMYYVSNVWEFLTHHKHFLCISMGLFLQAPIVFITESISSKITGEYFFSGHFVI